MQVNTRENFEIFLDTIVFKIQKFGGASTYWKELVSRFTKLPGVKIIIQSENIAGLNHDGQSVLREVNDGNLVKELTLPSSILRYLPLTKRLPDKALYHSSYYRTCLQKNVVNIFTIHDFTHKRGLASKFPRKLVHISLTALGLLNADGIICISEHTKRDLMHFYPSIPENKMKVIYHGISTEFCSIAKQSNTYFKTLFKLDDPFVLFIGKRVSYKKFDIVAKAIKAEGTMNLVIIGGGPLTSEEKKQLDKDIPNRYFKLDNLDNKELNILYNHAFSLIYPSIYEGFGIPILEAMKAGCPVITNNLSSILEVAGDAALFISEISSEGILNKILLLRNSDLRKQTIEKGLLRSKEFSWEKCYLETLQFYKAIYQAKFSSN